MELDVKFLPKVEFYISDLGETLQLSVKLVTYKYKVNVLGADIDLSSDKFRISQTISYIRRYLEPQVSINLDFQIGISNKGNSTNLLVQEFRSLIHSESSKIVNNANLSDEIKAELYRLKDEYKERILSSLILPNEEIRTKIKIDYDPIKGRFDKFNKESVFIEKTFVIPTSEVVGLNVDNYLMKIVSEVIFQPSEVEIQSPRIQILQGN